MSSVLDKESFDLKVLVLNKYSDVRSAFESSQDQKFNNMILILMLLMLLIMLMLLLLLML